MDERPWKSLSKRRVQHYGYEFLYEVSLYLLLVAFIYSCSWCNSWNLVLVKVMLQLIAWMQDSLQLAQFWDQLILYSCNCSTFQLITSKSYKLNIKQISFEFLKLQNLHGSARAQSFETNSEMIHHAWNATTICY